MHAVISTSSIRCDSCGEPASPEHIRDRLARLERVTRYRPIHISLLLICASSPERPEDDLYALDMEKGSPESLGYISGLLACLGIETDSDTKPAAQLAELQHRGIYLARLVECPLRPGESLEDLTARHGHTLLKRIALSYKPKRIALLDPVAPALAELLRNSPHASHVIANGEGIAIPDVQDRKSIERVRSLFENVEG